MEIAYNLYEEFPTKFSTTGIYLSFISVSGKRRFTVQTGKNDARLIPRLYPFFGHNYFYLHSLIVETTKGRHGGIISTGRRRPNRGGVTRTGGTPGRHYVGSPTGPPPPQCPPPPPPVPTVPPSIVVTLLQRGDHHGSAAAPCVTGRVRIKNGSHSRSYSTRTTRERGRCNIRRPTTRSTVLQNTNRGGPLWNVPTWSWHSESRGSSKSPSKTTTRIILDGRQRRPYNGEHAAGEETKTPRRRNGSPSGQWGGLANRIGVRRGEERHATRNTVTTSVAREVEHRTGS